MSKIAFIFPGQGSQYVGMCAELINNFSEAEHIMSKADKILDMHLRSLCLKGPEDELNQTQNTQPAIYTVSYLINKVLNEKDIYPKMVAGHSLGEYSALVAAGVFSFEDGLKLVRQRGLIMNRAVPASKGAMAAIIGLEDEKILAICQKVDGICEVANYNCPGQVVISGEKDAIEIASKLAEENGAKKVVLLDVSGPFHSSLMKAAEDEFTGVINEIQFNPPEYPVVANVTADIVKKPEEIKDLLVKQLSGSVRWVESIKLMINHGIDTFIEVGPGRVLKGLMRRIDRSVNAYNVEDMKSLDKLLEKL
ncbi:MAG: ACP S-malonyltransferase [Halanaerobiales bacterium]